MNKYLRFIVDRRYRFNILASRGFFDRMDDKTFLDKKFYSVFGRKIDWEKPNTYSEKLQWLKIYDRNPVYTQMVDKADAKLYVAKRIGEEYIIPTYGVFDSFDQIDFDVLPDQFVIKCTHDSGGVVICKDKKTFEPKEARRIIEASLKRNYYVGNREWPYKNVVPRIIVEKYMVDESGYELKDYKFFCFNGKMKMFFVAKDRGDEKEETKFDFFDSDFNHLPFENGHPNSSPPYYKPENFEKMKDLAEELSKNIPQLRVDFYNINGHIYFGELTFFHWSGLMPFNPPEWDKKIGEWIELPDK